jgi:hypothetical protein
MALRSHSIHALESACVVELVCGIGVLAGRGNKLTSYQRGRYSIFQLGSVLAAIAIVGSLIVLAVAEILK